MENTSLYKGLLHHKLLQGYTKEAAKEIAKKQYISKKNKGYK